MCTPRKVLQPPHDYIPSLTRPRLQERAAPPSSVSLPCISHVVEKVLNRNKTASTPGGFYSVSISLAIYCSTLVFVKNMPLKCSFRLKFCLEVVRNKQTKSMLFSQYSNFIITYALGKYKNSSSKERRENSLQSFSPKLFLYIYFSLQKYLDHTINIIV